MPIYGNYLGYDVFFHSNENNEPIHIHIGRKNCNVKIWILADNRIRLEENGIYGNNILRFKSKEIKLFMAFVSANRNEIINKWINHFESGQLMSK